MNNVKSLIIIALSFFVTSYANAADTKEEKFNPLETGVPSLTIAPDARAGAMGDIGAATDPDVFSQHWNPAKFAFAYSKAGIGFSFTPWLSKLVSDINLSYLTGYYKIGDNDNLAIGTSLRYFSLGDIMLKQGETDLGYTTRPYEMALDASIALKFSETFAGAVAFRYIRSDMGAGTRENDGLEPGNAVAADIAGYYHNYVMLGANECLLGLGFNASNIGSKISYDNGANPYNSVFLPTNLRLGASLLYPIDDYNTISFNADLNKYMVPTRPSKEDMTAEDLDKYYNQSPITGIFTSFSDASFKEEMQEVNWSVGAEYAYENKFFLRGGYFYENPYKGNRKYFSLGTGFKMTAFQLDVAYLISTVPSNPLDQTLRFSLSFDMDGLKNLMQ